MRTVTIDRLKADLESLYIPPCGAVATWKKIRQVLEEMERWAGVVKTGDLTPAAIARWITANPFRSPATTFTLLSSLRRACSYAVQMGWLRSSPFDFRKIGDWVRDYDPIGDLLMDEEPEAKHHPLADLTKVLRHLRDQAPLGWGEHRLFALAATTLFTGARAREVQCSRVEDFDLAGGMFSVRPNAVRRLKTRRSRRKVAMPGELVGILAGWLPEARSDWAFPGILRVGPWRGGKAGRTPLDRLKQAGEACGVGELTFQSLRHSYVTHSRGAWAVPPAVTQQLCGHTDRETTDGYLGFDPVNTRAAVSAIRLGLGSESMSA